jgi:glutamate N-acetyltransferase/amino-acid N-acetyltransferase
MLAFLTSDAAVEPRLLKVALETAVAQSFNRITIDGDMSTNDTVLLFANGLAGNIPTAPFQEALNFVTLELAKMIVRDGEGVTRFVTVRVHGARSATDADAVGRAIANSTLVKTSWCGGDPNWGRVLCAAGYSSARLDLDRIDLAYSAPGKNALTYSVRKGAPARVAFAKLVRQVAPPEFDLHVFLNAGKHESIIYTTDLTEEYVEFNKGNVSDPKSLGG